MTRLRFRWTRKAYRRAHHLARLLALFYDLPARPELVQRYLDLWERHPAAEDPLAVPLDRRLASFKGDDIPF